MDLSWEKMAVVQNTITPNTVCGEISGSILLKRKKNYNLLFYKTGPLAYTLAVYYLTATYISREILVKFIV